MVEWVPNKLKLHSEIDHNQTLIYKLRAKTNQLYVISICSFLRATISFTVNGKLINGK